MVVQNMKHLARTLLVGSGQLKRFNGSVGVVVQRFLDLLISCTRAMPTRVEAFEPVRGKLLLYWDEYRRKSSLFRTQAEVLGSLGVVVEAVRPLAMNALKTVSAPRKEVEEISRVFTEITTILTSR